MMVIPVHQHVQGKSVRSYHDGMHVQWTASASYYNITWLMSMQMQTSCRFVRGKCSRRGCNPRAHAGPSSCKLVSTCRHVMHQEDIMRLAWNGLVHMIWRP